MVGKESELWCFVDKCPTWICAGPHREVETTLGTEILRYDQEPVGLPVHAPPQPWEKPWEVTVEFKNPDPSLVDILFGEDTEKEGNKANG